MLSRGKQTSGSSGHLQGAQLSERVEGVPYFRM